MMAWRERDSSFALMITSNQLLSRCHSSLLSAGVSSRWMAELSPVSPALWSWFCCEEEA